MVQTKGSSPLLEGTRYNARATFAMSIDDDDEEDRKTDKSRRKSRFDKKKDKRKQQGSQEEGEFEVRDRPRRKFRINQGWGEASSYQDGEAEDFFEDHDV